MQSPTAQRSRVGGAVADPQVLIISHLDDAHAVAVAQAMMQQGVEPVLLDLARFPQHCTIELGYGGARRGVMRAIDDDWGETDLSACRAAWWRRPQPFQVSHDIADPAHRAFAMVEAREVFGGLWNLLDATWINDPHRDDQAHRKVYQLRVAESVGLDVPETVVTNAPETARSFICDRGGKDTIFKAFNGTPEAWRETRLIGDRELANLHQVRHAPVIFQDCIHGDDLRVTVIGDHIFPAEIDLNGGDYAVDFRMNYDHLKMRATTLPDEIEAGIKRLMKRLGIIYGAVDFRRTPEGAHVFLEVNPAGQWLFVEQHTGLPITRTLASELLGFARAHR